jgi:hypothetical protein
MISKTKLSESICYGAWHSIRRFLRPRESCDLSKDESGGYFVFRFTMRDRDGLQEIGRFTVLGAMIEDGIISEQRLHAALWQELGRIRGMA